jgi:hypothetical protein
MGAFILAIFYFFPKISGTAQQEKEDKSLPEQTGSVLVLRSKSAEEAPKDVEHKPQAQAASPRQPKVVAPDEPKGKESRESKAEPPPQPKPVRPKVVPTIITKYRPIQGRSPANCLALSPNGRALLLGCLDGTLRIVDVQSGKESRKIAAHKGAVTAVGFSIDGRLAISGGGFLLDGRSQGEEADGSIRIWDVDTGAEVRPPSRAQ